MIAPWAMEEMATVNINDERLNKRSQKILTSLGNRPNVSIPAASGGWAETKASYNFFKNKKTTFENVLQPHIDKTLERVAQESIVLLPQDTTEIDWTLPEKQVQGIGTLDGGKRKGIMLHEMHAFTTQGVPLGTVWAEPINRTEPIVKLTRAEKAKQRKETPIEEKESMRWLSGLRAARDLAQRMPEVQFVCIGDSESDIYEVLCEPQGERPVDWLVRAGYDRALNPEETLTSEAGEHLRDQVLATPLLYEVDVKIRGRKALLEEREDRGRRQNRESRKAHMEVRAATVTLRPPWRPDRKLPPVTVHVVLAHEPNPPAGEPAVEWLLVTTLPIGTIEEVKTVVEYYCIRWNIEIFFRTLKSGCKIEDRRLEHIDRMLPCLALYLIAAWRTMYVCRMGRDCPDVECEAIFEPSEWKAVWVAVKREKPPEKAPPLGVMVHMIAGLGGYIERKNSEPGVQTVWIGLQRMNDLAWAWDAFGPEAKIVGKTDENTYG